MGQRLPEKHSIKQKSMKTVINGEDLWEWNKRDNNNYERGII